MIPLSAIHISIINTIIVVVSGYGVALEDTFLGELSHDLTANVCLCHLPKDIKKSMVHVSIRKIIGRWQVRNHIALVRAYDQEKHKIISIITFQNITYEDSGVYRIKATWMDKIFYTHDIMLAVSRSYKLNEGESISTDFHVPNDLGDMDRLSFSWRTMYIPLALRSRITTFNNGTLQMIEIDKYLLALGDQFILYVWDTSNDQLLYQYQLNITVFRVETTNVALKGISAFHIGIPIRRVDPSEIRDIYLKKVYQDAEWTTQNLWFGMNISKNVSYLKIWNDNLKIDDEDAGTYFVYNGDGTVLAKYLFYFPNLTLGVKRGRNLKIIYRLPALFLRDNGLAVKWTKPDGLLSTDESFIKEQNNETHVMLIIPNFRTSVKGTYSLHIYELYNNNTDVYLYTGYYDCIN